MARRPGQESFFDTMIIASGRRTVVYSPDLLETVLAEMADFAERRAADGPLIFDAGSAPAGEEGRDDEYLAGLTVRLHETGVQVSARADTSVEDWGWPPAERLFVMFAGAAGGGVFASRSSRSSAGGAAKTSTHWSYDPSFAQTTSVWVAELMGGAAPDLAARWLARLSELALEPAHPATESHRRRRRP